LSTATGIILWHAPGPNDQLLVSRDLLLARAVPGDGSRWVTARTVTTGAEVYKFHLPQGAITGLLQEKDWLVLTTSDVRRLSGEGKTRWRTPFAEPYGFAAGGVVEVRGGDVVAFRYGRIHDSGVELVRLKAATGEVVWRAWCNPLGVGHSEYLHDATVAVEGERLRVSSRGSYGTFVEVLDLRTGKQLRRTAKKTE
jgi:outer membrane protein assembly factor BamB